jgi:hypothetical protein
MTKIENYVVNPKTGIGTFKPANPRKVAFIDAEAPYSDKTLPKDHPKRGEWNITKKGGKKKKKIA